MITVSKSTLASKFLETVHSQLTLRSGDTVTNDRIREVLLLLVENYNQYPAQLM